MAYVSEGGCDGPGGGDREGDCDAEWDAVLDGGRCGLMILSIWF